LIRLGVTGVDPPNAASSQHFHRLAGTDTIGPTLQHAPDIAAFRMTDAMARPGIYRDGRSAAQ
jgi:hypothetical protein